MKKVIILLGAVSLLVLCILGFSLFSNSKAVIKPTFKGFIEASNITEFDEIVHRSKRLVKLKIVKEIDKEDARKLTGESVYSIRKYTYYEAGVIDDYYDSSNNGEKIFLVQDSNYQWQEEGNPLFNIGDMFIMFLIKDNSDDDCWQPYAGINSIYDVVESSETYLYKRLGDLPCEGLPMSVEESTVVTSNSENPTNYTKKLILNSLLSAVESLGKDIDDCYLVSNFASSFVDEPSIFVATFENIVQSSERLVELQIIRELSRIEIMNLKGEDERSINRSSYFEAEVVKDYYDSSKNGERIFVVQDSDDEWNNQNNPIFNTSQRFVMFIVKNNADDDCWGPYGGANSIFDIVGASGETYLYRRLGSVPSEEQPVDDDGEEITVVNPVGHNNEITLNYLLSIIETYGKSLDDSYREQSTLP